VDFILSIAEDEDAFERLPDIADAIIVDNTRLPVIENKTRRVVRAHPRKITVKFAKALETRQIPIALPPF
jgi:hypothetical protein